MIQTHDYKRASIQGRIDVLKQEIYALALEEISEGARAVKLRGRFAELCELEEALKANSHSRVEARGYRSTPQRFGLD